MMNITSFFKLFNKMSGINLILGVGENEVQIYISLLAIFPEGFGSGKRDLSLF